MADFSLDGNLTCVPKPKMKLKARPAAPSAVKALHSPSTEEAAVATVGQTAAEAASDGPRSAWSRVGVALGALLVLAVVLYTRHPSPDKPQLWAEDASIFYKEGLRDGVAAIVEPYAGYHHAAPRLSAYLLHRLPAKYIPTAYACCGAAWVLALGAFVFHPRLRLPCKPALVVLLGLTPNSGETLFNLVNIQWHLCIGLMLCLMLDKPRSLAGWAFDLAVLAPPRIDRIVFHRRCSLLSSAGAVLASMVRGRGLSDRRRLRRRPRMGDEIDGFGSDV